MVIITKKRIIYKIGIILTFLLISVLSVYKFKEKNTRVITTLETASLPVNNKVIVLDAGHGIPDYRSTKH